MSVYRIMAHGEGLFYVRVCTEQANANEKRPECGSCDRHPYWGDCKVKGRFLWKDYGGMEGALEAAKALIRELKRKEAV